MTQLKPVPHGLLQAFRAYESALMSHDVAALDALYASSPTTLHGDADGLLVGHEQVSALLEADGGAPQRRIVQTHVQVIDDDHALILAATDAEHGGRGLQTQLWARDPVRIEHGGWQITAAHVSTPAPAFDSRIWRVVGDPLISSHTPDGALSGETLAVKDVVAVAGFAVGAGSPAWLEQAPISSEHAAAVAQLLDAGASVRGIARTEEFAYSLTGLNAHYGAPPNPRAQGRVPGGSSAGSATAVALGHASIGLGTDTGGSIRVPAAYQGLYGIRTSHGAVPRTGLLPLAKAFDTVGWMTRSAFLLQAVGDVLLPATAVSTPTKDEIRVVPSLVGLATPEVAAAIEGALPESEPLDWSPQTLEEWREAFVTGQAYQAWQAHGAWLETRLDTLGEAVRARFETARSVTRAQADEARAVLAEARAEILEVVGDRVLAYPSASSVAPTAADAESVRDDTMRLTCLAGIAGLPAVTVPLRTATGLPAGLCLVAAPGRDRDLLALAADL
ncbi:Asp-tRNA(Asn)/Glu-tRNA(Gln) amidotransferase A subunit family amidase [Nocardioides albertanoniae]|uniref:Asp-tRNA(Asn)/Glu-tRNA(Gln) amidotransferase A subunit family amidase n=1 Tax=Nocardioides albertanoniae TaxID=1175486 RepID=A0A543AAV3_9ACTN|nr:AtzH-like domain-containing protein [Nocardioides albertanoniae]TQL69744.1 Asp-tRNA(Asn)/Glu-tRNA(Gln) amidotransferase A subunit family amidase [Nocardioides albertanoniae]